MPFLINLQLDPITSAGDGISMSSRMGHENAVLRTYTNFGVCSLTFITVLKLITFGILALG